MRPCCGCLATLAVVGFSACDSDEGTSDSRPVPPAERLRPRAPSGPPITFDGGALRRSKSPPAGVAEQLSYYGVGDGSCERNQGGRPRIGFIRKFFAYKEEYDPAKNDEPVIGEEIYVCFPGFKDEKPISVAVTGPDRKLRRYEARWLGPGSAVFLPIELLPGGPLGRYAVSARQGSSRASSAFRVRAPNLPLARVVPRTRDGGHARKPPIRIVVVGLKPRRRIQLRLYRGKSGSGVFGFVTSLPVQLDANGEAIIEIRRTTASTPGSYLVVPNVRGLFTENSSLSFDLP